MPVLPCLGQAAHPEPEGRVRDSGPAGLGHLIQKHAATRLHYDLRVELDGVLKSWAVPKAQPGPAHRRLAARDKA